MAEDWFADVQKYASGADPDHVAGIVRYCGIALRKRDSALVSFSSPEETARVRENFLRKKLALTEPDSLLDAAIAAIGERMKDDRTKNRVTVYYLLADHFGRLDDFIKSPKDAAAPSATAAANASMSEAGADTPASMAASSSTAADAPPSTTFTSASPSYAAASEQSATPNRASGSTPPTEFGKRASAVREAARSEAAESSGADGVTPSDLADTPSTGFRWWPWLLLFLAVIVIILIIRYAM